MVVTFFVLLFLLAKKEGNLEYYKHLMVFSSLPKNLSIKHNMNNKSEFQLLLTAYESILPFDMHVKFSLTLMGVTYAYYGITRPLGVNICLRQTALLKFRRKKKKGKEIPVEGGKICCGCCANKSPILCIFDQQEAWEKKVTDRCSTASM